MRYFLTLLRAHLVCRLRSSAFWACALCFLLLAATLAAALPQENRLSLEVGLLPRGTWGEQVAGQLLSGRISATGGIPSAGSWNGISLPGPSTAATCWRRGR